LYYTFSQSDSYVSLMTNNNTGQEVSLFDVERLEFDNDGLVIMQTNTGSGEFQVNTNTSLSQEDSSITTLTNGGFVVTWTSNGQDGDGYGIYAQMYNANGTTQGSEFQVNTFTTNSQYDPSITALNNGGFVVTWQDGGIYAQMYDANGDTQGSEFQLISQVNEVSITALNNGGFVVTWEETEASGYFSDIFAQMYNADGTTQGNELQVNTVTYAYQFDPSIL